MNSLFDMCKALFCKMVTVTAGFFWKRWSDSFLECAAYKKKTLDFHVKKCRMVTYCTPTNMLIIVPDSNTAPYVLNAYYCDPDIFSRTDERPNSDLVDTDVSKSLIWFFTSVEPTTTSVSHVTHIDVYKTNIPRCTLCVLFTRIQYRPERARFERGRPVRVIVAPIIQRWVVIII